MKARALNAGFVYQNELFPTDAGTPQGGIISPGAANMTLDTDRKIKSARETHGPIKCSAMLLIWGFKIAHITDYVKAGVCRCPIPGLLGNYRAI